MQVLLIHVDGKLPNLALMKLAHWYRSQGHTVTLIRRRRRDLFDRTTIRSMPPRSSATVKNSFPKSRATGPMRSSAAPELLTASRSSRSSAASMNFTIIKTIPISQNLTKRGCRLSCKFCVVPKKKGKPYFLNSINDIWRGAPYPRKLHLLDNDFFGHESWRNHIREIIDGNFRVCLSQGINVRMITTETAEALASIQELT